MSRHSEGSDSPYNHLKGSRKRGRKAWEEVGWTGRSWGLGEGDGKADREQKYVTYHSTHFQHQPRS